MKRTREQVIWDFVQSWLRKAESDLRAAELLLSLDQEDYFAAGFHAQQAAEKFLKALLVWLQIPFPKTHEIARLTDLGTQGDPSLRAELQSADMLTPFGVEFRYPSDEVADAELAREAVNQAKNVREAVLGRLAEWLAKGRPL